MKINVLKEYWPKFRQQAPIIIFVSTLHVWWSFNFPPIYRLGHPWSILLAIAASISGVIAYAIIFSSPQQFVLLLKFDQIDESQFGGAVLKKIMPIWIIIVYHFGMLIMWYKDFYRVPSIYYLLIYIYSVMVYILLFRAAKSNSIVENDKN